MFMGSSLSAERAGDQPPAKPVGCIALILIMASLGH
jgi:hypothetical protein